MTTETVFVLHAYQPPYPIQIPEVVKRITQRTYLPFAKAISELENAKVVLNMNGCLTKMLQDESPETVSLLGKAIERGTLELIDSGCYHPILPFVEDDAVEFVTHIEENRTINTAAFNLPKPPIGFWPPELAVSTTTVKMLVDYGFKAIMAPANVLRERKRRTLYGMKSGKNSALLLSRHRDISNCISFRRYDDDVGRAGSDICGAADWTGVPVVLAMDLETFGEHHQNYIPFLFKLLNHKPLKWIGLTDLVAGKYHVEYLDTICSTSWSTEDHDRDRGIPYSLWNHPQNPIHQTQQGHMALLRTCLKLAGGVTNLCHEKKMRYLTAVHSCQFWWATGFGYMWSPPMITKGFEMQMASLREIVEALTGSEQKALIAYSELLYERLKETLRTH
jgi:hypothetical protein